MHGASTLLAALPAAVFALLVLLVVAWDRSRHWRAARLRALAEAGIVSADYLESDVPATVEVPGGDGLQRTPARVLGLHGKWVDLAVPSEGDVARLAIGTPLRVTVAGRTAAFRFHASLHDRHAADGTATLTISRPAWIEKIQRREHFRVAIDLPIALSTIETCPRDSRVYRGSIENLSGAGFRMTLPVALAEGAHIRVRLPIASVEGYAIEARVLRCSPIHDLHSPCFRLQAEFLYLNEETLNRIVAYCMDVERSLRRQRLSDAC